MKSADILRSAKKLIENPENWCKGVYAKNSCGKTVSYLSPDATSWCAMGAILKMGGSEHEYRLLCTAALGMPRCLAFTSINGSYSAASLNDACGHEVVMTMFDQAIFMAESEHAESE